jgi:hypothetical protein
VRGVDGDPQTSEQPSAVVRRCSYCREAGHYRPTCGRYDSDLQALQAAHDQIVAELEETQARLRVMHGEKSWWIDEAFRLRDEVQQLRRLLNSMAVSAGPTLGR